MYVHERAQTATARVEMIKSEFYPPCSIVGADLIGRWSYDPHDVFIGITIKSSSDNWRNKIIKKTKWFIAVIIRYAYLRLLPRTELRQSVRVQQDTHAYNCTPLNHYIVIYNPQTFTVGTLVRESSNNKISKRFRANNRIALIHRRRRCRITSVLDVL